MKKKTKLSDFDFVLPDELIAQYPSETRGKERLLRVSLAGLEHYQFEDILKLIGEDDLIVLNNTKVLKARLKGLKDSGGSCEIMVERILGDFEQSREAHCQIRASKPIKTGRSILINGYKVHCIGREKEFYLLEFPLNVGEFLESFGEIPIPPYLGRDQSSIDHSRYQTVYGKHLGAVAAPTAGLHITEELLEEIKEKGVKVVELTLHIGAGTFQAIRTENIKEHQMHREWYEIPKETADQIHSTKARGGRVVAVGTTVVRALESAAVDGVLDQQKLNGDTSLFITPGFEFQIVDCMVTNFHLPRSSLLLMVAAFAGQKRVLHAYEEAVKEGYRFFSYGDASWLEKNSCSN